MKANQFLRRHLESIPPYTPIEPFEVLSARLGRAPQDIIKLDANENPYGIPDCIRQALAEMAYPHIYPDPESRALRSALSNFSGVPQENLLAGSGADELIDLILRLVLEPGDKILNCPPTFGMYAFDTDVNAGSVVNIPRQTDFGLDLPVIQAAVDAHHPKLIFIATPNNPDGSMTPAPIIDALLELRLLVVLDEAYIEFSGHGRLGEQASYIQKASQRDNLIVLRTFSKWAGLAGLRVGYGAFPSWMMPSLWKAKQPYNVSVAASTAAIAALEHLDLLAETVERLRQERQRLFNLLSEIPFLSPYSTHANFILCKVSGVDAAQLKENLAARYGILLRYFNKPGLQDHIRVSVGKPEHTDALIQALKEIG
ncbi:MAG: histidinol-phosphate transaminase [Chloroflexota bacterium]